MALSITISPNSPQKDQAASTTVDNAECEPFTVKVICTEPGHEKTLEEQTGSTNPTTIAFTPTDLGTHQVVVICEETQAVEGRKSFTVT